MIRRLKAIVHALGIVWRDLRHNPSQEDLVREAVEAHERVKRAMAEDKDRRPWRP